MPLSRTERFKLKSGVVDVMDATDSGWDFRRTNLLLTEFGFGALDGGYSSPSFEDIIATISDHDLVEMYSIVTGVERDEVQAAVLLADSGSWKSGYVRLFVSHSARHKRFVGEVADELAIVGIHAFVAHDTMEYSKPWQAQIEQALQSMQAFVAIVHPEFNDSAWCHQEVGWALGRRVPRFVMRLDADPAGFVAREQWPTGHGLSAKDIARVISEWASSMPELGKTMVDGLFASLESAGNYMDAGATAERIAALSGLTQEQWDRLDRVYWGNDQLYTGVLPTKALEPFYRHHNRTWPPSRPTPPPPTGDPWASQTSDEPPF